MHKTRLVPRGLTIWGIIAAILYFGAGFVSLFGLAESSSAIIIVLNIPLALQELILAIYLIAKGFNKAAVLPEYE